MILGVAASLFFLAIVVFSSFGKKCLLWAVATKSGLEETAARGFTARIPSCYDGTLAGCRISSTMAGGSLICSRN